jgi:hypothetical protein
LQFSRAGLRAFRPCQQLISLGMREGCVCGNLWISCDLEDVDLDLWPT